MITGIFKDFVLGLAPSIAGVNYCQVSDGMAINQFQADARNETVYPGIFFVRPGYKLTDNNMQFTAANFQVVAYVLMKPSDPDDPDSMDEALDETERITIDLQKKLLTTNQHTLGLFSLNDWESAPVTEVTMDRAVGYEVRFRLGLEIEQLY